MVTIIQKMFSYKADWLDVGSIKIAVIAATLLLAKLWEPVLDLEWYWYLVLWVMAVIRPFITFSRWIRT